MFRWVSWVEFTKLGMVPKAYPSQALDVEEKLVSHLDPIDLFFNFLSKEKILPGLLVISKMLSLRY